MDLIRYVLHCTQLMDQKTTATVTSICGAKYNACPQLLSVEHASHEIDPDPATTFMNS